MNTAAFLVKIITEPEQSFFKNGIAVIEFRGKVILDKFNSNNIFNISIWKTSSSDTIHNYKINNYFIIEGYISLRENFTKTKKIYSK